jgi:large subunit ribosomal protein L13
MKMFKTYTQKTAEIDRQWYLIDAAKMPLGKLSVVIANKLTGKAKPTFTPHIDSGDHVVVVNAGNLLVTGSKMTDKKYYRHSGHIGNLKEFTLEEIVKKDPAIAIEQAVKGMMPKNKLAAARLARLHVFSGPEHTHSAQTPKEIK